MQPSLIERIHQVLKLSPESPALEFQGQWFSWQSINDAMNQLEDSLVKAGLGEGDVVGVLLRNRPAHVAALMQVLASRRCVATINPFQSPDKVSADIRGLKLKAVICDRDDLAHAQLSDTARECGTAVLEMSADEALHISTVQAAPAQASTDYHPALPNTCILMLTSGTTGPAKRIELPYRSFALSLMGTPGHYSSHKEVEDIRLKDTPAVLTTPLVHIGGMFAAMAAVTQARPIVILEKFSVAEIRRALTTYRPKLISLPPAALRMVMDADTPVEELSSLLAIRCGSAPLPPALQEEFENKYGVPLLDSYGATEFAGAVAGWTIGDHKQFAKQKRGSVGRAQPGTQIRVVNADSGEVVPPNTTGILEVISNQIGHKEWTRTTDLAQIDEDGFLYIKGRADDAIIRGGFKILPQDVVAVLRSHDKIKQACVVGIPDQRLGEVPVAAIELRPGSGEVNIDEIIAFAKNKLTSYQVPTAIKIVEEMPRTPSMKISKHAVKNLFLDQA
ncbi:acyl--CoA ligase [Spongiibacter sp. KMU-166]|uniref:Acyl--CoA ligase n=1 Tax=Spongiibacter thalassae TaxID=2721624 RepID=A0ABX1GEC1_9GAMM|nr:class I adenylate-forming enzyme family protein [Spongiibacter thalassae]NKI16599.1 acyl--CoA ligase [Spongiibacter thalassae]